MSMQKFIRSAAYPRGQRPDFAKAYAKAAYRYKFNVGIFPGFAFNPNTKQVVRVHAVDDIDNGTKVTADSLGGDMEYVVPVTVGTPGVTFQIDFDTGSSDFWVWGKKLPRVSGHHYYDPRKSSTYKPTPGTFEIHYGDTSYAKGILGIDDTTIGDITIKNQVVEIATEVSDQFLLRDVSNDGLLGLAWPDLNTATPRKAATPVENMISQNLLAIPVFSCALGRGDDDGFYSFGYIDPDVTPNPLLYTPVDKSNGWWEVPSASYTINGKETKRTGNTCILDTGTTLILIDDTVVSNIYGSIPGAIFDHTQGGWMYPVDAQLPEIAFAVGDKLYKMNPKDIPYGDPIGGYYFGGIQSRGDFTIDIFGDSFLKAVYAVFNQGEATVGLAQRDE